MKENHIYIGFSAMTEKINRELKYEEIWERLDFKDLDNMIVPKNI